MRNERQAAAFRGHFLGIDKCPPTLSNADLSCSLSLAREAWKALSALGQRRMAAML